MSSPSPQLSSKKSKIYRAGAGAGKTTRLIGEVYSFYREYREKHKKNPKIVLTTFTRKATQELKERLMLLAEEHKDYEFLDYILEKNSLLISTIHGVLQIFLKHYAQVIDLDPGFQISDKKAFSQEAKSILRNLMHQNEHYALLLEELSFNQLAEFMIEHSGNILLNDSIEPLQESDFKKAIDELKKNLSQRIHALQEVILSETDDSGWKQFLLELQEYLEFFKQEEFSRAQDILSAIKKPRKSSKAPKIPLQVDEDVKVLLDDLKEISYESFAPEFLQKTQEFYGIFQECAQNFHKRFFDFKKKSGKISMSDLEPLVLNILKQEANRYSSFSKQYDYWLIDEFQDTSPVQVEILMRIIGSQSFFVVGDPQQSIYYFRGARVEIFDKMQEQIVSSGGSLELLNTNYRSSRSVMSFINYFFNNYERSFHPMDIGRDEDSELPMMIGNFLDSLGQAEGIANHILNLSSHSNLGNICVIARKNSELKTISEELKRKQIPFYLHSAQGFSLRREILDIKAFIKFLINPHDNHNLMLLLRSPWFPVPEETLVEWVSRFKKTKIKGSYWSFFSSLKGDDSHSSLHSLKGYGEMAYTKGISLVLQNFFLESQVLESSLTLDPTGRREANLWKFLTSLRSEDYRAGFNYLEYLSDPTQAQDADSGGEDSDALSSLEPNQVQLMTVHMSKGLEFDHVIIPYANKGLRSRGGQSSYMWNKDQGKWGLSLKFEGEKAVVPLPLKSVLEAQKEEEEKESHRLLYVAMTRAKKSILLASSGKSDSKSWMSSVKIPLEDEENVHADFSYMVKKEILSSHKEYQNLRSQKTPLPLLFDLSLVKKEKAKAVASGSLELQDSTQVIPLMEAADRGTRLHRILESLRYHESSVILSHLTPEESQAIQWLLNNQEIPFQEILNQGHAEWGFVTQTPQETLSGQIDLWAEVQGVTWILDYKTGNSQYSYQAIEQLKKYADVLKAYGKTNIQIVALFPFEKTMTRVEA